MANPYFRHVPNFDYVNRFKGEQQISNYIRVKNLFKRGKLREDIFDDLSYFDSYKIEGETIWVITEWDRSVTTILLPDEY